MTDAARSADDARSVLHERGADWLGAVARRRSRRAFDDIPADTWQLEALEALARRWRPYPDARIALVAEPDIDVFTGAIGPYGKVTGAPHILVFIADDSSEFADQHVAYTGEAIMLEATTLGLATCWVGGFFSQKKVARLVSLAPSERVFAVSPLGFALMRDTATERTLSGLAGSAYRKVVAEIAPGAASARGRIGLSQPSRQRGSRPPR